MFRAVLLGLSVIAAPLAAEPVDPKTRLDELFTTERRLAEAATKLAPAEGIASMLADDALLFTRQGVIRGRQAAQANLADNPVNRGTHASWRSIRAGISGDGKHGFTLGYLDIGGGDPATAHRRYLAYWIRGAEGWRVAALKQLLRVEGETDAPAQPAVLPQRGSAPEPDKIAAFKAGLIAAENAFSDRAQVVGIRQAFQENGRPDAVHMFHKKGIVIGLKAIGENQSGEEELGPAKIRWSASDAIAAASGDLGMTIGTIRQNGPPPEGKPAEMHFFTIWMRDGAAQPWRYIAE